MANVFKEHGQEVLQFIESNQGQVIDTQALFSRFTLESFAGKAKGMLLDLVALRRCKEVGFGERFDVTTTHKEFANAFTNATMSTDLRFTVPQAHVIAFLCCHYCNSSLL